MLSLDSVEWKGFEGGYRILYDASNTLKLLESKDLPDTLIWDDLWENLYHQGDVDIASYATVPQIFRIYKEKGWIDHHLPNFAGTIEEARTRKQNPGVPDWLKQDYFNSLLGIAQYCLENFRDGMDKNFTRALLLQMAVILKENGVYNLLDAISIGEEEKALEAYQRFN